MYKQHQGEGMRSYRLQLCRSESMFDIHFGDILKAQNRSSLFIFGALTCFTLVPPFLLTKPFSHPPCEPPSTILRDLGRVVEEDLEEAHCQTCFQVLFYLFTQNAANAGLSQRTILDCCLVHAILTSFRCNLHLCSSP